MSDMDAKNEWEIPSEFLPDWASPPGDTIKDCMEERGWGMEELIQETGMYWYVLQRLIDGDQVIDEWIANRLSVRETLYTAASLY